MVGGGGGGVGGQGEFVWGGVGGGGGWGGSWVGGSASLLVRAQKVLRKMAN